MKSILTRLISWWRKEGHTSREANSSHSSYSITHHNLELKSVYSTTMTDYNNGNFDLFKYQLKDEQKIVILYILRNFLQDIKDEICEAIDLAIDKYLSEIDYNFYDNEWHINNEINFEFNLEDNEWHINNAS